MKFKFCIGEAHQYRLHLSLHGNRNSVLLAFLLADSWCIEALWQISKPMTFFQNEITPIGTSDFICNRPCSLQLPFLVDIIVQIGYSMWLLIMKPQVICSVRITQWQTDRLLVLLFLAIIHALRAFYWSLDGTSAANQIASLQNSLLGFAYVWVQLRSLIYSQVRIFQAGKYYNSYYNYSSLLLHTVFMHSDM